MCVKVLKYRLLYLPSLSQSSKSVTETSVLGIMLPESGWTQWQTWVPSACNSHWRGSKLPSGAQFTSALLCFSLMQTPEKGILYNFK